MDNVSELRLKFLQVLFDDGDHVAFGMDDKSACKPVDPVPSFLHTDAVKFCINPCKVWRNTSNVTSINALLFEMDKDPNGKLIPIKEQIRMFIKSGLPYTTLTYSGKKSVHCIVRLTEPIKSPEWQKVWWNAIYRVLTSKGLFLDTATKAVPQLSRTPDSLRGDTNKVQRLIHINRRVSQLEVIKWLEDNGVKLEEPRPQINNYVIGTNDNVKSVVKWQRAVKMNQNSKGEYKAYATTGNHMWLFNYGLMCWKVDLSVEEAIGLAVTEWGHTYHTSANGRKPVADAITSGWNFGKIKNIEQINL